MNTHKTIAFIGAAFLLALAPIYLVFFGNPYRLKIYDPIELKKNSTNQINPVVADLQFDFEKEKILEAGVEFSLKSCRILDGYRFQLVLEGGNQITAQLTSATKDEATQPVVDLLKQTKIPSVLLRRKSGDVWIVDIYVSINGKITNLIDELRTKGLLF
jgi:hypothetical protein